MTATEIAAWWGAIIATFIFAWDIYKWKQAGPKIDISISTDMETWGAMPSEMDGTYVVVTVNNSGDQSSTITHLFGYQYPTLFHRIFRKEKFTFFVTNPGTGTLPHVLKPGEQWRGAIDQNSELEKLSKNGYLFCGVYHSSSRKAIVERLVI